MKKVILFVLVTIIVLSTACTLVACKGKELTLYVQDGVSALSVAKIIKDGKIGDGIKAKNVKTIISANQDVIDKCSVGEADMAVLPTNTAVKICSGSKSDYVLFGVNSYGGLYIVGTEELTEFTQLKGKTMVGFGRSDTPDKVLEKICSAQKVNYRRSETVSSSYLSVKYVDDVQDVVSQIVQGDTSFAMLEAPYVAQCVAEMEGKDESIYTLFDLQELWKSAVESDHDGFPQTCMIVKRNVLSKYGKQLESALAANAEYMSKNASELQQVLQSAGSELTIDFTEEVVERCNVTFVSALDARGDLDKYLEVFGGVDGVLPLADKIFGK